MQCGSIADASGHECVMPGAKHRFWCKPILFLLANRVLNASPVGEGLRKTTQERSPLTNAMPRVRQVLLLVYMQKLFTVTLSART